ncbi:MAG: hypothetical protein DRP12_00145 [Candidatus Aenigmatarchaeota archaeon]|nr:MAG: hypothetical protein DRP12_00145 [Candidatus Aenigmarchaeota archaeon]
MTVNIYSLLRKMQYPEEREKPKPETEAEGKRYVQVWYWEKMYAQEGLTGKLKPTDIHDLERTHDLVWEGELPKEMDKEDIFRLFQDRAVVEGIPLWEERSHTSMSVGDVIGLQRGGYVYYWIVKEIGFGGPLFSLTLYIAKDVAREIKREREALAEFYEKQEKKEEAPPKPITFPGKVSFIPLSTRGFASEIHPDLQAKIWEITMREISPKTDFIVFDPDAKERKYEDEGRTLRVPMPELPKKVYAKLDDFGSPEVLSEQLGTKVNTQYLVTFMLAEEY